MVIWTKRDRVCISQDSVCNKGSITSISLLYLTITFYTDIRVPPPDYAFKKGEHF